MNQYFISLDVGGTSIKSAVVEQVEGTNELLLLEETYQLYPSKSDQSSDDIVSHLACIIAEQTRKIKDNIYSISAICFAFPGPFDYENGISHMQGIGKFDAIYGVCLREKLQKKLKALHIKLSADIPIIFENDATAFAGGEFHSGVAKGFTKVACFTLGTGCGSTFLQDGKVVKGKLGIPENGMVYDVPFKDSILDDYVSRRYILKLAQQAGFDTKMLDVKELEQLAKNGNQGATTVFELFGQTLGQALNRFLVAFSPDVIVFGGRISKAYPLFQSKFEQELYPNRCHVLISQNLSKSALIGIATFARSAI